MNNKLVTTEDLSLFIQDLRNFSGEKLTSEQLPIFMKLAENYFSRFPLEELADRYLSNVFGTVHHLLDYIQRFDGNHPKIQLFNPRVETDGWICPHTILVVLQRDMPFLVDSIRIELNRRNIAIHSIKSTVMNVTRDHNGELVKIIDNSADSSADNSNKEALVYLEINLLSIPSEMEDITKNLHSVLTELNVVVNDYRPMLQAARDAEENLKHAQSSLVVASVDESKEFLLWLRDNNFTFLGYSEYEFGEKDGKKFLREQIEKRLGVFAYKGGKASYAEADELNTGMARFHLAPQVVTFSKSSVRSRIHRQAYSDYIVVKRFNNNGEVSGEVRFLGLYTSNVYVMSPAKIPLLRNKVNKVFERSGLGAQSHDGKHLLQILETFPRDELFLSNSSELYDAVTNVAKINERYMVRLLVRRDPFGKFVSCIVYIPRDVFTTQLRLRIQDLIAQAIKATECEFTTYFSESILARVYLVFKVDPNLPLEYDQLKLQQRIREISRSWEDHLQHALIESNGEEAATHVFKKYRGAFPSSYKEHFDSSTALRDITSIAKLQTDHDIAMSLYRPDVTQTTVIRFKIFRKINTIELSDIIPVLENLGLRVISENPYMLRLSNADPVWLHDFQLSYNLPQSIDIHSIKDIFQDAFSAIWHKHTDNDAFNKLVLSAQLEWRQVTVLRAYANYMRQTLFNFSEHSIASALINHSAITRQLFHLFTEKFNPQTFTTMDDVVIRLNTIRQGILKDLDAVENLNDDKILRRFLSLIDGSVRTNYFQSLQNGEAKSYLSIKLSPRDIADIPEPRPLFEIYVFSPRVEGVHLRGGKVARGGLRWSDRLQDYRTEVLGLVKAQQVKNAIIVPSGAKGGFVCKQSPQAGGRDAIQQEGIECYKIFIRGLLDLTDNLINGQLVPPKNVVRFDQDDPYLVVAADKGTASFSDIANNISFEYNHWLGDAFASGGSQGYDHKGMGITARGGWISVMRHFKEQEKNIQEKDFSVIGIGDMAGDVFGNGMLLSHHICLTAAFNHQHIFIDPTPDAEKSFVERKRLFVTPKTSWADYDTTLISSGGGIFNRSAKTIAITPEMKKVFDIHADTLTPAELISCLLKAPVDLIWNGGIGTYVKATSENHAEVGDKANDGLRVNGNELRCKVFGEGGNLGMTQRGRIEYSLNGGACNTDFIDNAGGVDCSDHEVNVKILLNEIVATGQLTSEERNRLLTEMTENVARLVLENNYRQTQAISVAEAESTLRSAEYRRFMAALETQKRLNRKLEFLPTDDVLIERQTRNQGLTRPELAILLSYAKAVLKEDLALTDIADDPYMAASIEGAFPEKIAELYPQQLYNHRLRREIVATQIANDIVNNMGISFVQRLSEATGAKTGDVAKAYVVARDIYRMEIFLHGLEALDYKIPAKLQTQLMINMIRRVRRATRWFLRNRRALVDPQVEVTFFMPAVLRISAQLPQLLKGDSLTTWNKNINNLRHQGVPDDIIHYASETSYLYSGLSIAEAAKRSAKPLARVTELYFKLSDYLGLPWVAAQISELKVETFWQAMARETYMDDLESQLRSLTISLIGAASETVTVDSIIEDWSKQQLLLIKRWKSIVSELQTASGTDFAVFSVALRDLLDLSQATQHSGVH